MEASASGIAATATIGVTVVSGYEASGVFPVSRSGTAYSGIIHGPTVINGWSVSNPFSGWRTYTQDDPYRKKLLFLRDDNKVQMRYEIDEEGPHLHCVIQENGFEWRVKVIIPESIPWGQYAEKAAEIKAITNSYIEEIKKLLRRNRNTRK